MDKTRQVLTRRVEKVYPSEKALEKVLHSGKKIRLYFGVDPTGPKLHLGHTVGLKKLQEFADLGHESILLMGTGTVLAGDPSERNKTRALITQKEIDKNIATWKSQAGKILDFKKVKIKYNGDWLVKLQLKDIINIASKISAVQLFKRNMFQERLKRGDTVWAHETLYPLLQGYDSVAMDVDLEIGGTDQTFNMLIGRELQRKMNNREKFILTLPMILGIDGKQMSKTSGNCVWLTDSPTNMFGKIMSIADNLIDSYIELLTDLEISKSEVKQNPLQSKKSLAFEIVRLYHGSKEAKQAQKEFEGVFQKRGLPENIKTVKISKAKINIIDLLTKTNLVTSRSEAKRLVSQGAVEVEQKVIRTQEESIEITKEGKILRVGKRRFLKILL